MSERKRWEPYKSRDKFPCKGCTDRTLGCHDRCDRYLDAKRVADSRKAAEYEKRIAECGASEVMYKNALKNLRKKMPQR